MLWHLRLVEMSYSVRGSMHLKRGRGHDCWRTTLRTRYRIRNPPDCFLRSRSAESRILPNRRLTELRTRSCATNLLPSRHQTAECCGGSDKVVLQLRQTGRTRG